MVYVRLISVFPCGAGGRYQKNACPETCPYLTQAQWSQQGTRTQCAGKFQQLLEVLTAHQGHQELWNRSPFQPCASS